MTMMRPQSDRSRPEYLGINRAPSGQGSKSQRTNNTDETGKADKSRPQMLAQRPRGTRVDPHL